MKESKPDAPQKVTRASLATIVGERLRMTQTEAEIVVEATLNSLLSAFRGGQNVELRGFGSFKFRTRAPRKGRNPKTGASVDVPAKRVLHFKMGKELKALLDGDGGEKN